MLVKRFFLLSIAFITASTVFSQVGPRKLYFFADTAKINSSNPKALEIDWTSPIHYSFIFYSKVKAPYYNQIEFASQIDKNNPKPTIENKKPKYKYISLQELVKLGIESPRYFSEIYDLYIIEPLPKNKFRTYKVVIMEQKAPITDGVILNNK
ncbi:hypothetical protein [Pedobacter miscanthi]|uniref:Uncharacterized protein n=1 Tax=Pedobacter miscanthi TaxID=2259170 RepID=A0A366KRZ6_9SPHI|nr:hypothetical protein [Pedobacter miscanthi]RBQ04288.1 hypothetical protein DRW42_18995 [Pedobacter miscanthi]